MKIKKFSAENFRNIENCEIEFSDGVNFLYGNNAQGKTNIVEGIYIFSRGKSFRSQDESELIKSGEEGFRIYIEYSDKDENNTLEYAVFGKEKRRKKNGYKISNIKEMISSFKAVLFSPEDLSLIKDGPEERRKFLNVAISGCYNSYIDIYSNYKKALENRNHILKDAQKGFYYDENEIISWSLYMAEYASYIYKLRNDYVKKCELYTKKIMKDISSGLEDVSIFYKSDIKEDLSEIEKIEEEYKKIFCSDIRREIAAGTTLFGPHRDDIEIYINGMNARKFASQGQQRSLVLSLKLSEGEIIKEISGDYPVFLFDDVLSELDFSRREYILSKKDEKQIIISSCEYDGNLEFSNRIIEVKEGKYKIKK